MLGDKMNIANISYLSWLTVANNRLGDKADCEL